MKMKRWHIKRGRAVFFQLSAVESVWVSSLRRLWLRQPTVAPLWHAHGARLSQLTHQLRTVLQSHKRPWYIKKFGWQHVVVHNVWVAKCLGGKMLECQNVCCQNVVLIPKWCGANVFCCQNVVLPKCWSAEMSWCKNVVVPKCCVAKMSVAKMLFAKLSVAKLSVNRTLGMIPSSV